MIAPRSTPQAGSPPGLGAALELAGLGVALALACAWLSRMPSWYRDLGTFQALYAAAFVFYGLAVLRLRTWAALPGAGWAVFGVASACRVLLAPLPPSLSGDLFRYVWEGRVWLAGGDPYRQAPLDPALAALREAAVFPFINHPHLATIYPPLAQAGFALVAAVSATVVAFKAWVTLHDLALVVVLLVWCARERGSAVWALAYAWNPLVLVEYAGTGHNDPTAMLPLALALMWREQRPMASAAALAWGGLTKLAPLLAAPFLWRAWPWRARILLAVLVLPGLAAFVAGTRETYSGLVVYWGTWRNNELLFHLAERVLGSFTAARAVTLALVAAVLAWDLWRRREATLATRDGLRMALVTSPVVHPWYAGWVLMFEPLAPSAPWLLLSGLLVVSYGFGVTPPEGRSFHTPLAWRWIEYGVPAVLALFLGVWSRFARGGRRGESRVP